MATLSAALKTCGIQFSSGTFQLVPLPSDCVYCTHPAVLHVHTILVQLCLTGKHIKRLSQGSSKYWIVLSD